ncbi:MAG: DUF4176 domain-containing protein, partial [Romboutsia sp.]|nr:DUF4176 domain-containing protein [Romboutsia sp.]
MEDKFLPIGTVCLLKGGSKKIMITGYLIKSIEHPNNTYDYSGCMYPEGIISSRESIVFNHDQINEIVYKGFDQEEYKEFNDKVKKLLEKEKKLSEEENNEKEETNKVLATDINGNQVEVEVLD